MFKKHEKYIGKTFGRLTIVGPAFIKRDCPYYECLCSCGNTKAIDLYKIRSGHTKSCGCLKKVWQKSGQKTHGMCKRRVYIIWTNMIARCRNKNRPDFYNYGGRGISVCERWRTFENFFDDMGEPESDETLDRVDVNGDYEPDNCKWSTRKEQANNRRKNAHLVVNGERLTQAQAAQKYDVDFRLLSQRIKAGWLVEEAVGLTTRKRKRNA